MDMEKAFYVFRYYSSFMTPTEIATGRHLETAMKATHGRSDPAAQAEAEKRPELFRRWLSEDPSILLLARDGYDAFVERTAERILKERGAEIYFNVCPRCERLTRTPKARQCRFCGHDWHGGRG